jgi:NodT family efflux transporter outer membrane factor (OMF) lipoprotein
MKPSFLAVLLALSACSLAPDYKPPDAPAPAAYKESGAWVEAKPADAVPHGAWWKIFQNPELDALEDQVTAANQNLKIALAQYDQAQATTREARAAYFPVVTGKAGEARERASRNVANKTGVETFNDFAMGADLSYEIDIWGRVRNTVAANADQAQASAADLAGVELSLHASLASTYFALRGADAAQGVLDRTVETDRKALALTRQRYAGGVAAEADVDQAETQLENAKTQATDKRLQRAQLEHALALLTGKAPADFSLPPAPLAAKPPRLDASLPSVLLERRPDIAAAERRAAAANAEIGVARAAWFPAFNLTAMLGLESATAVNWLKAPSNFWFFGPSAAMPLFEGGKIAALTDEARAAYDQAVASYRQTVLDAYGEVEDNLAALHKLEQEAETQKAATAATQRALAQAGDRYKGGLTTYLDVAVAQDNELQARLASVAIEVRRLNASVQLVKALGGGWEKETDAP